MKTLLPILLISLFSFSLNAQEEKRKDTLKKLSNYQRQLKVGNPTNKDAEMAIQDIEAPFYRVKTFVTQPWFDYKKKVNEKTGLQLSVNYTSMFMGASDVVDENADNFATSGIFDATLNWQFINRKKGKNQGNLIFWVDSRHLYAGDNVPQFFNFQTGSALIPATKFNEWSIRTLEFYYQQKIADRVAFAVGKIDLTDWFSYNGLIHPMKHFMDYGFSVNPTTNWPNAGLGIVAGGWLNERKTLGFKVGVADMAGDNFASKKFMDFGTEGFQNGSLMKIAEINFSPGSDQYYFQRVSFTYWHSDELTPEDDTWFLTSSSSGWSVQGTWVFEDKYIPVVTFGMSDGEGGNVLSNINLSMMHGWFFKSHDLLGIGLNYTQSSINDEDQYLTEIFYRYTVSRTIAVTPVFKTVLNPALNPDEDLLFYYGIRSRISL